MKLENYTFRISGFRHQLFEILSVEPLKIMDLLQEKPLRFDIEGVYTISTPDDNEIVYVGKTLTKSVIGRIADHRNTDTKSDLKGMLELLTNYPQEVDSYLVRCIEVTDARQRTLFEHFAISVLQPAFNK